VRWVVVVEDVRSSRSGILGGDRVNLKLIIQRMDRCQQWLQLLQNCLPFWGTVHRCRTDDEERDGRIPANPITTAGGWGASFWAAASRNATRMVISRM
jgi:hypothetical protein